MTTPTKLAAAARRAPRSGLPKAPSIWVDDNQHILAELCRSEPGDPRAPDGDAAAGWRLCGHSDRSKLNNMSVAAARVRNGMAAAFRLEPGTGSYQATVSQDPDAPRQYPVELYIRYLTQDDTDWYEDNDRKLRESGVKRVAHRSVRHGDETPEQRAARLAAAAVKRSTPRSTDDDGTSA